MSYKNGLVITEAFMNLPEVKQAKKKYGARGMGIIFETLRQLNKCKNSLGVYVDITIIADEAGINIKKLLEWYDDTHIFTVKLLDDVEKGTPEFEKKYKEHSLKAIIYCGRTRMCFKNVPREPTQEEIDDVLTNGSIYTGDNRKSMKKNAAREGQNDTYSTKNKLKTRTNLSKVQLPDMQTSDVQGDTPTLIHTPSSISSHSDIILHENNNIRSVPQTKTNLSSSCKQAEEKKNLEGVCGENFNFFREKIFSTPKEWKDSLNTIRGIDFNDEKTVCIFAKWMYNYCVCSRKMPQNDNDFFQYIFALLDKRHATRKIFDEYYNIEKQKIDHEEILKRDEERRRANMYKDTGYENLTGPGTFMRMEKDYKLAPGFKFWPVPVYAIDCPNPDLNWSNIYNDWVAPTKFDYDKEHKYLLKLRYEILKKREERRAKRHTEIWKRIRAYEEHDKLIKLGVDVCCIYDAPKKHPNRKPKDYKNPFSGKQFLFCRKRLHEDDFYNNKEDF